MLTAEACQHRPFLWYTRFTQNMKKLHVFPLCLSSRNIIDPTTIFENKILTSESDNWWFTSNQTFRNIEYKAV